MGGSNLMSAIAGRVLLVPKGNYDSTATYTMLDMVVYNGSSYICKQECTGVVPTNTTYWMLNASGSAVAYINDIGDVVITNVSNGQVLMYDSTTQKWVNGTLTLNSLTDTQFASLTNGQVLKYNATSQKWENADEAGGILPHLIVISETGSTVTATKGTTVITATETSTEHYECDVPEFGTWTIDAILGGDDAQVSLVVDTVKVYTVDDSHFHADISVTYPTGATCSLSDGTTTLYANTNPYTFTVHNAGTWTLSVSLNGKTYTDSIVITATGQTESVTVKVSDIYDGSTVTPTNDVETWLYCADLTDTGYTILSDVLNDNIVLRKLMANDNAVDYLVRSASWVSDICGNENAMVFIGASDYASDTLLADEGWCNGICNSEYAENVLNVKVPAMTSETTPSGNVIHNNTNWASAYKAFDGNTTSYTYINNKGVTNNYIGYVFENLKKIFLTKLHFNIFGSGNVSRTLILQAGNESSGYTDLSTITQTFTPSTEPKIDIVTFNPSQYDSYRLFGATTWYQDGFQLGFKEIQFYGREAGGVQTWLKAGGITNKNYTTLAEVLADTTTLASLMASSDAVDYLVTAKAFIDGICADQTAMSYIGLNNYCADTLLADSDWLDGIWNSTYFESVLNVKVPVMTSNTTPSGECFASSVYSTTYPAWKAFTNQVDASGWNCAQSEYGQTDTAYVGYEFSNKKKIYVSKFTIHTSGTISSTEIRVVANDASNESWNVISEVYSETNLSDIIICNSNLGEYKRFALKGSFIKDNTRYLQFKYIQFYGREDV